MYGKCIVADYNSVHKDKCSKEFLKFKDCYLVSTSHSVIIPGEFCFGSYFTPPECIPATRLTRAASAPILETKQFLCYY